MVQLNLYSTLGCHLCDDAKHLLRQLPDISIHEIDIADDDDLLARYGTLIPVVSLGNLDATLNWPFTLKELKVFIQQSQLA